MATVQDLIDRFQYITQDAGIRWTTGEVVTWLNEAYQQVVVIRPDVGAVSGTVALVEGHRQRLDDATSINLPDAHMILDVTATAGDRPRAIRRTDTSILDGLIPDWRRLRPTSNLERWAFDDRNPREFVVYPPAATGTQVEIIYSQAPTGHDPDSGTVGSDTIKLPSAYEPALLDYVLYRGYAKDADSQANASRAAAHREAFVAGLNAKAQSDTAASPSRNPG